MTTASGRRPHADSHSRGGKAFIYRGQIVLLSEEKALKTNSWLWFYMRDLYLQLLLVSNKGNRLLAQVNYGVKCLWPASGAPSQLRWDSNARSTTSERRFLTESSHQVLGHRLGADVNGETGQLRRVLELSVERSQVHGKEVVLGKRGLLKRDERRHGHGGTPAKRKPQRQGWGWPRRLRRLHGKAGEYATHSIYLTTTGDAVLYHGYSHACRGVGRHDGK